MRTIIDTFKLAPFVFTTEFDTGAEIGGETSTWVAQAGEPILSRTFYFGADQRHIRAFAKKFATDAGYRQACLDGTARWARINAWFLRNNLAYHPRLITSRSARPPAERRALRAEYQRAEQALQRLYTLIERNLDTLEASPAYQEHLTIEQALPEPSMTAIDPEIQQVVAWLNHLPGVVTTLSCQGLRRGVQIDGWEYGPIWFPGKHESLAYVHCSALPAGLAAELDVYLRQQGVGVVVQQRIQARRPEQNGAFIAALHALLIGKGCSDASAGDA